MSDPGENGSAAEMDARAEAKFRSRVVETARAAWVAQYADGCGAPPSEVYALLLGAEAFESAAAEYLRDGAK